MPEIDALLINDHYRIKHMFRGFTRWTGDLVAAHAIGAEITAHMAVEEDCLLPVVRTRLDNRLAEDIEEDHELMRELVEKLSNMKPESKGVKPTVFRLQNLFLRHIEHVEHQVFPGIKPYRQDIFDAGMKAVTRSRELLSNKNAPKMLTVLTTSNTGWGRNSAGRGNALANMGW
ncbi:MAG TPA: hemerythrin domain-containing protein [Acidimicrobiales bacterium]|nr:hemerythrin domain-containing protein [Acidimicrobiales bacterium]